MCFGLRFFKSHVKITNSGVLMGQEYVLTKMVCVMDIKTASMLRMNWTVVSDRPTTPQSKIKLQNIFVVH